MRQRCWLLPLAAAVAAGVLLVAGFRPAQSQATGAKWALLIGIEEYEDSRISRLPYSQADVLGVARALRDQLKFDRVLTMTGDAGALRATQANVLRQLRLLGADSRQRGGIETLIVYFTGHGFEKEQKHYLAAADTRLADLSGTGIGVDAMRAALADVEARQVVFFFDACRNDPSKGGEQVNLTDALTKDLIEVARRTGSGIVSRAVFFACSAGEKAYYSEDWQQSVFTHFLLEALGGKGVERSGEMTMSGVGDYVQKQVLAWSRNRKVKQLPDFMQLGGAKIVLASGITPKVDDEPQPLQKRVNPIDGAEMVYVPGGTFQMGSNISGEKPVHTQTVAGFWMYTKEVTNGQYRKFVQANSQWSVQNIPPQFHSGNYLLHWRYTYSQSPDRDNYPVVYVSWYAAKAYAEWAGRSAGSGQGGKLPTEAQWEYAARGGRQLEYPTVNGQLNTRLANYDQAFDVGSTKPVGQYPANPFGLYDMAGNVLEWCSSLEQPYPYSANDGRENPNANGLRAVRGGSWYGLWNTLTSARRDFNAMDSCYFNGFRVVVSSGGS